MEALQLLDRNEMKNIMAGSIGCTDTEWTSCGSATAVFNCWYTQCGVLYSGAEWHQCRRQVADSHKYALAKCGTSFR